MAQLLKAHTRTVTFVLDKPKTAGLRTRIRAVVFHLCSAAIICATFGVPLAVVMLVGNSLESVALLFAWLVVSPLVFAALCAVVAGVLSMPFQRFVVAGVWPRDLSSRAYAGRRLYGLCWTCIYYCQPVYAVCLAIPLLKWCLFRLFGYRSQMNFTVYPDTWIRDLPLLRFGCGAYVSNRVTLGTNVVLRDGDALLVGSIYVGARAVIGHAALIGPGTRIARGAEVGVASAVGFRSRVHRGAAVQPNCSISHRSAVGSGAVVGLNSVVGSGATVPSGTSVGPGSFVRRSSETGARIPAPRTAPIPDHGSAPPVWRSDLENTHHARP